MSTFSCAGRFVATAATVDNVGAALWNPHTTKRIWVTEIDLASTVATISNPGVVRTSTRGTQTLSITPDIDNCWERDIAPVSGALLDLTYSAQPTVQGPYFFRWNLAAAIGAGFMDPFVSPEAPGICVPPGTGLAVATPVAVILQPADITFTWIE